jgi:predicted murein hydrolase (TIGR00659 family)
MTPTSSDFVNIWVYLSTQPLLWLTATLVTYLIGEAVSRRLNRNPLANPVVIASAILAVILVGTRTPYAEYFEGAQFVHFMLGPATVALAIPLYQNLGKVRRALLPMAIALAAGAITAASTAVGIAWLLGAPPELLASMAPKSVTAPIAMDLAKSLGGIPSVAALMVAITGISGALMATPLLNALRVKNYAARGFAAGVTSHGLGTARAFQVSELAGTFAGIAMGLNGALTSLIVLFWLMLAN